MKSAIAPWHYPLLLLALIALGAGVWAALLRVGWALPPALPLFSHGPLMIGSFFGTLISIERAVALNRRWLLIGPALSAASAVALLLGATPWAAGLQAGAALLLALAYLIYGWKHMALYLWTMLLGALLWGLGAALWGAGWHFPLTAHCWVGFLVLTVSGERLELSRVTRPGLAATLAFAGILGAILVACLLALIWRDPGLRLLGLAYVLMALWLLRFDVANRAVRAQGLARFIAVCLLAGYLALLIGGLLLLVYGGPQAGYFYDAQLHSILVGFIFSMVLGHAPLILPVLTGIELRFDSRFYAPLALLHASVILRLIADLSSWWAGRQWAGLLSLLAVLFYLGLVAMRRASPP